MELAQPDIPAAVYRLAQQGVNRIVTVPLLLFTAGHARRDIPVAVRQAADRASIKVVGQSTSLDSCEPILQLSSERFLGSLAGLVARAPADPPSQASRWGGTARAESARSTAEKCSPPMEHSVATAKQVSTGDEIALVLVGRGSRSPTATEAMLEFARRRGARTPVGWLRAAFMHGQRPTLEEALEMAQARPERIRVVQPHLLFEGELMDKLRHLVARKQEERPDSTWVVPDPLGVDDRLAAALIEMAEQVASAKPAGEPRVG